MDFFQLEKHGTNIKQEMVAGTTTFLTMAYIIFVNPGILGETGMDKGALITVTCLAAFIGTMITALWVNAPLAMAPGMGLNAFFTYTLVFGMGATWNVALGVVFISGIAFLLLTMTGFREKIIDAIPLQLRLAVGAGIGLFIAFIGMKNLGLIVANPATLVGLGPLSPTVILGLIGLTIMGGLEIKQVKGGILIGIVITTVLGMVLGYVELPNGIMSTPPSIAPIAFKLDILGALKLSMIGPIFSFMFVDLFDSVGTIVACANEAEMIDEKGKIENVSKILEADAAATVIGSLLGTSTTTTFVESASGIAEGGRTGLTSATTAILFFLAMFFTPVIGVVPAFATAPALIIVGVYMFKNLIDIDLHKIEIAIPAFLTIILMPLTYSISTGITFGFISYAVIEIISGKVKTVKPTMWIIVVLSTVELLSK
ncbi:MULTISPECIES: NCS2 family permease [Psychrilyobacter]|uniref:NCS2 family permease n=1 Tax=Psychrilyobacter piezotolerans TaxID=2293438 RepID=A0ABX9KIU7_9FUSO|nr:MULTISPECIES: NCS2 family permease [Psychrilyobacter]MCS5421119.1 NCS2 family permease [Psychrilyobacter sp. S5]NDI77109.1 NCS2 family permease [Psychrilyobacter piezotolerans]RDE64108.1 NCS2 family permease [Psychrilyobacter sp. S5]REI42200.1 NCS2 family permease [Psychrilyobacter piezotolerans]